MKTSSGPTQPSCSGAWTRPHASRGTAITSSTSSPPRPSGPRETHAGPDRPHPPEGRPTRTTEPRPATSSSSVSPIPGGEKPRTPRLPSPHFGDRQRARRPGNPLSRLPPGRPTHRQHGRHPNHAVAHRAGSRPEERRRMEDRIGPRSLRAVVGTLALEAGIDCRTRATAATAAVRRPENPAIRGWAEWASPTPAPRDRRRHRSLQAPSRDPPGPSGTTAPTASRTRSATRTTPESPAGMPSASGSESGRGRAKGRMNRP